MKIYYSFLWSLFMISFLPRSLAQNPSSKVKAIHLEISPFLGELQIKNHLLKSGPFGENPGVAYGGALSLGATFKKGWGITIGVHYLSQIFTNRSFFEVNYSNPNNVAISSNDFDIDNLNNSFSNYDIAFTIAQLDGTSCMNPADPIQDGEALRLNFIRVNPFQQIGIPIKLEKTLGKKKTKLYLGLGLIPIFVISNPQASGKYRQDNQVIPHDFARSKCYVINDVSEQIAIRQQNLDFKNQNLKDSRLDLTTEFGLLNEGAKNTFKLTLFYNESLTGFTQVEEVQYQAQTVGVKFSLRKNLYKNKT